MNVSGASSYAMQYAAQAPPALAPAATAYAADVMVASKGLGIMDQQGQAVMALLQSAEMVAQMAAVTGVGGNINTYA